MFWRRTIALLLFGLWAEFIPFFGGRDSGVQKAFQPEAEFVKIEFWETSD